MIVDDDMSLMFIDNKTEDMAYLLFAVDFFEDESCQDELYEPKNVFLQSEMTFYEMIEEHV
jgi:hypothetical protein